LVCEIEAEPFHKNLVVGVTQGAVRDLAAEVFHQRRMNVTAGFRVAHGKKKRHPAEASRDLRDDFAA